MSYEDQENAMIQDVLAIMLGFEGEYVRYHPDHSPQDEKSRLAGAEFKILPGLNPSLKDMTSSMVKTAKHYLGIHAFLEVQSQEQYGLVNHALCSAVRRYLQEVLGFMVKMEQQSIVNEVDFTLHKFHLQIIPYSGVLLNLYRVTQEMLRKNSTADDDEQDSDEELEMEAILQSLRDEGGGGPQKVCKGGNVLRLLTEQLAYTSGDPQARKVLLSLLHEASRPYMTMLNEWLHRGTIKDPHGEFFIQERESISRERLDVDFTDAYWDKRYTVRDSDVPPQLEAVKAKVLLAGKYLNVVRECGGVKVSRALDDVPGEIDDPKFLKNITEAYDHANSSLLKLLLTTHNLAARLLSMKHYFFQDSSDFFSHFLLLAHQELRKPVKEIKIDKVENLWEIAIRQSGTVTSQDAFKEDAKVHFNEQNLSKFLVNVINERGMQEGEDESLLRQATAAKEKIQDDPKIDGYGALEIRYAVPFPLSLVISSKTVVRYQILFRFMLSMRHVEELLTGSWTDHNKLPCWTHRSSDPKIEVWKRRTWTLRARMLSFVQQYMYYFTNEVIEQNWQAMIGKVNKLEKDAEMGEAKLAGQTVDGLMEDHVDFLDTCLKECGLMTVKLVQVRAFTPKGMAKLTDTQLHTKILSTCSIFASHTSRFTRSLCSAQRDFAESPAALKILTALYKGSRNHVPEEYIKFDPNGSDGMMEWLVKYEDNFNKHFRYLLDALDYFAALETPKLGRLCAGLSGEREKEQGHEAL